jgi:SAM-dependent methyltransferase
MTTAPPARRSVEPDHVERNRTAWERWAPYYLAPGRRVWAEKELRWGIWGTLESELNLLKECEPGLTAVELGCGTASMCAKLTRIGLHAVGIDISQAQLDNALALQREFDVDFRLERANAEAVPYESESFDLAISDYGASVWCDPYGWIPEVSRILRPGGLLIFIVTAPFLMTCTPGDGGLAGERLERPYFGMHRFDFGKDETVEFHLGHGEWFRVLTASGFAVENLIEVRPGPDVRPRYRFVSNEWAGQWPSEDVWMARKR